jgi:proteasome lid subunit RPN8/RPN11
MTDPTFTVDSVHQDAPFRQRSGLTGYCQFADRSGAVFLAPEVSQRLWEAARIARPFETGGLLAGRVFGDDHGRYVIVVGYVEAPSGTGRPSRFELSPEATSRLRADASHTYPTADVVGWWHSHGGQSDYSQTDLSQQRIWTQPESVGILVFAEGRRWGAVHQGPDARLLSGPMDVPARPADHRSPGNVSASNSAEGGSAAHRPSEIAKIARHTPTALPLRVFLAGFALFALLAMVASVIVLGKVATGQHRLPAQIGQILRAAPRRMWLNWSCISQSLAPGTFVCVADVSDSSDAVEWQLDGRTVSRNQIAIIRLPISNVDGYQIQVLVRDHGQTYYGGSEMFY